MKPLIILFIAFVQPPYLYTPWTIRIRWLFTVNIAKVARFAEFKTTWGCEL